jgi:hypothetical protein
MQGKGTNNNNNNNRAVPYTNTLIYTRKLSSMVDAKTKIVSYITKSIITQHESLPNNKKTH